MLAESTARSAHHTTTRGETALRISGVAKTFTLHNLAAVDAGGIPTGAGTVLPVIEGVSFEVRSGEAVVLGGPSGVGKSTLLRILFGNYRPTAGRVEVRHAGGMVDIVSAAPRQMIEVRRLTLGWVSQFLRVIPRVSTLDIVRDPMITRGLDADAATARAREMLARLNLPERLWSLPPQTFSGGEQQRVNIARSFVDPAPILLLDEPTASLDAANRAVVVDLIKAARHGGAAVVGIFHDEAVRAAVATRVLDLAGFKPMSQ